MPLDDFKTFLVDIVTGHSYPELVQRAMASLEAPEAVIEFVNSNLTELPKKIGYRICHLHKSESKQDFISPWLENMDPLYDLGIVFSIPNQQCEMQYDYHDLCMKINENVFFNCTISYKNLVKITPFLFGECDKILSHNVPDILCFYSDQEPVLYKSTWTVEQTKKSLVGIAILVSGIILLNNDKTLVSIIRNLAKCNASHVSYDNQELFQNFGVDGHFGFRVKHGEFQSTCKNSTSMFTCNITEAGSVKKLKLNLK